jgi:oligogalacturonide lyase
MMSKISRVDDRFNIHLTEKHMRSFAMAGFCRMRRAIVMGLLFLVSPAVFMARPTLVGKIYPPEQTMVQNPQSAHEIIQWTRTGSNNHLYFNIESFIDATHVMFYSDRSGKNNLFSLDMASGSITQMTDEAEMTQSAWHLPQFHTLWFQTRHEIKALNTVSLEAQTVFVSDSLYPESFAVTCDGKYLVFAANKNPGFSANHSTGPWAIFRYDLAHRELKQISPDLGFKLGHVQTSPVDPSRVSYCWQHVYVKGGPGIVGNTPNRIWWNNIEGTDGGPVGIQEFGLHRTHEFWYPDGSLMGYSARYMFGPKKGNQYVGFITPDGKRNVMMPAPVSSSHNQMYRDNKHWVSDLYDGPNIVLFTIENDALVEREILYKHESSMEGQSSHPHPHFSPDGKYILFSTDRSGKPQVYTVRVDIGK